MTSLQRAAQTEKSETKKGAFESSFAAGLDLSEFGGNGAKSTKHTSAAAELLRIKAQEAQRAAQEEEQEARLFQLAKQRGRELRESDSATDLMDNANISATLVHMHSHDDVRIQYGIRKLGKKRRSIEKTVRQKRRTKVDKGTKGAIKKSKRSKY